MGDSEILLKPLQPDLNLWFEERLEIGFGSVLRVLVKETLLLKKSPFQQIAVLDTAKFGRMLVLDGIINVTEFDEFAYHEMIVHVPMICHPCPRKVLVIGGGDGGAVREALKHPEVREVHLCEIDREVVEVSKEYLPEISAGLDDHRVTVHYADGAEFVKRHPGYFDVILVDSTDPVGPGAVLFREEFFRNLHAALSDEGIVTTQCESFFFHREVIGTVLASFGKVFPVTEYYYCMVPTYPSGVIGFAFGCKSSSGGKGPADKSRVAALGPLKYYSSGIHEAAFVLPRFAEAFRTPESDEPRS